VNYSAQKILKSIRDRETDIAVILSKGHDVELRKDTGDGIKVIEVSKKMR